MYETDPSGRAVLGVGLRPRPAGIVGSNPTGAWVSVCCECCMLMSGRGLCEELATRPEESYRLWCVIVCDLETPCLRNHTQTIVTELKQEIHHWMYFLYVVNSNRQTRLLNVLGQIARILGDKKNMRLAGSADKLRMI